ncbi:MAG: hypothetical protein A2103_01565 [Gammaproteobacteria bacterium GWF2_41_13]|nr:MAG: hypothetical protein A2103_01565 [Gammaproteobacteria bacterium GWF2_41_13]
MQSMETRENHEITIKANPDRIRNFFAFLQSHGIDVQIQNIGRGWRKHSVTFSYSKDAKEKIMHCYPLLLGRENLDWSKDFCHESIDFINFHEKVMNLTSRILITQPSGLDADRERMEAHTLATNCLQAFTSHSCDASWTARSGLISVKIKYEDELSKTNWSILIDNVDVQTLIRRLRALPLQEARFCEEVHGSGAPSATSVPSEEDQWEIVKTEDGLQMSAGPSGSGAPAARSGLQTEDEAPPPYAPSASGLGISASMFRSTAATAAPVPEKEPTFTDKGKTPK